jgi:serine/threonine-protein kinase
MNESARLERVRAMFAAVRDLPAAERHPRLLELGADPLLIAEIDAMLVADAPTSAWSPGHSPAKGDDPADSAELGAGETLGSWRLLEEIGCGGMGAVFLAERSDGHFDQRVAIKLIRGIADSEIFVHFARERQILARLQHPHIARLLDGGATPGGQPYLVMEHVEGVPIERYCVEHALDLNARLRLFQKVCEGVQYAHRRLVVHCDLKPSNVLVRADGTPVLLDFGISRALDQQAGSRELKAASAWVTPMYASPEQLRGEAVTTASDVFSLGLILFELLAGRRARIDADDHTITLLGQSEVKPSALAGGMPWVSRLRGDLDAIVQRATAADPARRYESAESLAADIQRYLDLRPISAREGSTTYRLGRLLRRRWPVFAAAALILALGCVFTWQLARERDRALKAEQEALLQARTAERVSDFLVSVFNVSNPKLSRTRTLSARDVLDQGAERIESELADAPAVKARLLAVLGSAYRYIGESGRAAELLDKAAKLYLDPIVDQPLAAADVLSSLAVVYSNNEFPASKAESAAEEALRLRELHAPADSLPIADALNTLGIVRQAGDKLDEAEALLKRSLAIRERLAGKDSIQVATTLHNLGRNEYLRGDDLDKSIAYFERSMALKRELTGTQSPDFEATLTDYGKALRVSGQLERALEVEREALQLARSIYGDASELVAGAHNELGYTLHDLGRFSEAAVEYTAALEIRRGLGAGDTAGFAIPLNNLASVYEDMGDYATAEPLFRQSLAIRSKLLDADSPMIANAEYNLARLLIKQGRPAEATLLIAQASESLRARFGEQDRNVARVDLLETERLLDSGDLLEAAALLARIEASPLPLGDAFLARREALASRLAERNGDAAKALAAAEAAWNSIRKAWSAHHPLILEYGLRYADLLRRDGRAEEAHALTASIADLIEYFPPKSALRARFERALR